MKDIPKQHDVCMVRTSGLGKLLTEAIAQRCCLQQSGFKPSTLNLQPSNLQPSTSNLQPSTSNLQHSTSNIQTFNLQPSNLQPLLTSLAPLKKVKGKPSGI
jgi:hypothetical protein